MGERSDNPLQNDNEIELDTADGTMRLYDVEPSGVPRGAVVVVQEAFGVTNHIEDVARRFAALGYHAVAPHLYHRTGDPVLSYDDLPTARAHMGAMTDSGLNADIGRTVRYLAESGYGYPAVAVVGFCMGGSVALYAAAQYPLGAAVGFYGGGIGTGRFGLPPQVEVGRSLETPFLGLYGDEDDSIPVEDVESLRESISSGGVEGEIVRYPEAGHGFHCDARASFHRASAEDAWQRTLAWLQSHLHDSTYPTN